MAAPLKLASGERLLPAVLSMTAGAVDVIGFLSFGGLLTAHVTGNLVLQAAHFIAGGFNRVGPLLAVPLFVAVLGMVTLAARAVERVGYAPGRALLILHATLLAGCLALGTWFGPFHNPQTAMAVLVGMLAVAAMATQNALVKLALPGTPATAVMTTNLTQLTIDLVTLTRPRGEPDELAGARHRVSVVLPCVIGFVTGCAAGVALEVRFGLWALALPLALAVVAIPLGKTEIGARRK